MALLLPLTEKEERGTIIEVRESFDFFFPS